MENKKYNRVKNAKDLIQHILDVCQEHGMSPHEFEFWPPAKITFSVSDLSGYHSEIKIEQQLF